jgi:hypothetical protein
MNDAETRALDRAATEEDLDEATAHLRGLRDEEPDVLLDVPELRVDEISLDVEDLRAQVSLQADVLELLKLHVGVDAALGRVELTIKGVEAKVLLKVHLDNVARILDRVLTTIDNNPAIVERLTEQVGRAVEQVGTGAGEALGDLGAGAGAAVEEIGEGGGAAVGSVGRGAGRAVEDVGRGAGGAVEDVGEAAGTAVEDVGEVTAPKRPRRRREPTGDGSAGREREGRPRRKAAPSGDRPRKVARRPRERRPEEE